MKSLRRPKTTPEMKSKNPPESVQEALLSILKFTILAIRAKANERDFVYEISDHAHNLPDLVKNFEKKKLEFYMNNDRRNLLESVGSTNIPSFMSDAWLVLEEFLANDD